MEFVEPKRGDRIASGGRIRTIDSFSEDNGTFLRSGQWVDISDFEKNEDGVWVRTHSPRTYEIGEPYKVSSLRKGVAVVRPAVFAGGVSGKDKVVTTSPCCQLYMRRLDLGDPTSDLAARPVRRALGISGVLNHGKHGQRHGFHAHPGSGASG